MENKQRLRVPSMWLMVICSDWPQTFLHLTFDLRSIEPFINTDSAFLTEINLSFCLQINIMFESIIIVIFFEKCDFNIKILINIIFRISRYGSYHNFIKSQVVTINFTQYKALWIHQTTPRTKYPNIKLLSFSSK